MGGFDKDDFSLKWFRLSLREQMGNIGSEFDRAISWRSKGRSDFAMNAFDRTLDLLDLTIADPRWRGPKLKELTRTREIICDMFIGDNAYGATPASLSRYFLQFAIAARMLK